MFQSLKGMPDLLPEEVFQWQSMEHQLQKLLSTFGYQEIRTPFLESTELFARSIGASTDIVEKEMFAFQDKGGTAMALRPEGTASVVRAFLEHHLEHKNPLTKVFYVGPMFRHERPQKGRLRQFHQVGIEAIGSASPLVDAEVMMVLVQICKEFGVKETTLELNSLGDDACRPAYRDLLQTYFQSQKLSLCETCHRRVETNPLRVFDCKNESCQKTLEKAPLILDHLCGGCKEHFQQVQNYLSTCGISFHINPRIVRGLDYYTRTAFEVTGAGLGSQNAVGAGGRYDGLAEALGGSPTPGIGFAMGLERLLLASTQLLSFNSPSLVLFLPIENSALQEAFRLTHHLRNTILEEKMGHRIQADILSQSSSIKSGLRQADKRKASFVVILGQQELDKKVGIVKDLEQHTQKEVSLDQLVSEILRSLYGKTGLSKSNA